MVLLASEFPALPRPDPHTQKTLDGFDDDDVPLASPEIQIVYEAASGRFMLAFNRLDNLLTELIETVLLRLNRPDLMKASTSCDFWSKLLVAELLKYSTEGGSLTNIPITAMREVITHRNKVAHGHFDQNPFSGEYDIVEKEALATYSAKDLNQQTENATKAWDLLRYAEAFYGFSDVSQLPSQS